MDDTSRISHSPLYSLIHGSRISTVSVVASSSVIWDSGGNHFNDYSIRHHSADAKSANFPRKYFGGYFCQSKNWRYRNSCWYQTLTLKFYFQRKVTGKRPDSRRFLDARHRLIFGQRVEEWAPLVMSDLSQSRHSFHPLFWTHDFMATFALEYRCQRYNVRQKW